MNGPRIGGWEPGVTGYDGEGGGKWQIHRCA